MKLVKLKYKLSFISLIVVYAPTEMCGFEEKEIFHAKLASVVDQCPPCDIILV